MNNYDHGGNLYAIQRQRGVEFDQLLDFSANINPLGLSPNAKQAIIDNIDKVIHYPDVHGYSLKNEIKEFYNVDLDQIVLGNGAVELMYILCHTLRPSRVLVMAPSFNEYERAARSAGAEIIYYFLKSDRQYKPCWEELAVIIKDIQIVFIGNPNNPTGTLISRRELEHFILVAKNNGTIVVVDESFLDFLPDNGIYSCRSLVLKYHNLIILNSLTKFFAIPGLRLGFGVTCPDMVRLLENSKDPWNVNVLAQYSGIAALRDKAYQQVSRMMVMQEKERLYFDLKKITGILPCYPSVNFILINLERTGISAAQLQSRLLEYGIMIRDCSNYPGLTIYYIRVAVKMPQENIRLINSLRQIVGE